MKKIFISTILVLIILIISEIVFSRKKIEKTASTQQHSVAECKKNAEIVTDSFFFCLTKKEF